MRADRIIDASGLNCPLPVLKARKALDDMQRGEVLHVIATDPDSLRDFEAFSRRAGHKLHASGQRGDRYEFLIEKGWASA